MFTARYGTVSSDAGTGIELQAVAAVVIGGVAIFGGSGTVWGAAIGAVLLVTINRALPILGIPDFWQRAVVGVLILSAIVLDRVLSVRRARQLIESRDDVMTRTYADYTHPLWRRLVVTREAVLALLVGLVVWRRRRTSPTSARPLTMNYLLLDVTPILLIALPMTMVIITGEIDLSVASVVGLSSVLLGVLARSGVPIALAAVLALLAGARLRGAQRLPRRLRRAPVARRDDRDARPLPWPGRRAARARSGHRLPAAVDGPGDGEDRSTGVPLVMVAVPRPRRWRSCCCCTSPRSAAVSTTSA